MKKSKQNKDSLNLGTKHLKIYSQRFSYDQCLIVNQF